ncbi:MAG: hypothetical protein ACOH16_08605 [Propionibacteriaceae bacterium]
MAVSEFFAVLRRRWLLVLVGFLMTVGLSGAAYMFFKPTYEVTGTVLLLPPPSSADNGSVNPYLQLGGLRQAVDLVGVALSDQATQIELKAMSKDVEFTVQADVRTSSPLLVIDVKDSSPETAMRIRDLLVARVPLRLEAMQQALGVSAKDRVTTSVLTLDVEAEEVGKNRLRAAVVAAAGGLVMTLGAATLWDARRLRRPRRRREGRPSRDTDQLVDPPVEATVHPEEATAGTPVSPASPLRALDPLDEATAGTPVSPASPLRALDPLEEAADAPDNAAR